VDYATMFLQYNNYDIAKLQAQQNALRFTPEPHITSSKWQWVCHILKIASSFLVLKNYT
jgi:hypothetical protein